MRLAAPAARVAGSVLLAATTLGVIGLAGARTTASQSRLSTTRMSHPLPAPAAGSTEDRLVVAVVLGTSGTVATDAMGPYEVFGRSSRFTVYTVAERRSPAPVEGAPSILPDHTFAEVDARADLAPDVVVVPAVTDPGAELVARNWVVRQHDAGAHVLSVCAGALLLAETELLEGRTGTSHWSRLAWLRGHHPETHWVSGERFVRDGSITTTAGITSGIAGALSVVEDLASAAEANRIGAEVGYPGWSPDAPTTIPVQHWSLTDRPVVLNTVFPWWRPTVAITLDDGVGEIDAASLFEVYGVSAAARTYAVSRTGVIVSAHGLRLLTLTPDEVPDVDVALRPGVVGPSGRAGFDVALERLARTSGAATARSAAKMIDYPTDQLELGSARDPRRTSLLAGASLVLAVLVGAVPALTLRAKRRRREPN